MVKDFYVCFYCRMNGDPKYRNGNNLLRTRQVTLYTDLGIKYMKDIIQDQSGKHHTKLGHHDNPLVKRLLESEENRKLKRKLQDKLGTLAGRVPIMFF